jgi:hypothetical protein
VRLVSTRQGNVRRRRHSHYSSRRDLTRTTADAIDRHVEKIGSVVVVRIELGSTFVELCSGFLTDDLILSEKHDDDDDTQ